MRLKDCILPFLILAALVMIAGCAHAPRGGYPGWSQTGTASWYGEDFHGKPTASGETYNMYGISAAHNTLPLGTRCRVTNLDNGNTCVLTINDRGPFVGARILDLSYGAARRLGMVETGLARVRIDALDARAVYMAAYTLQFGAYKEKPNALAMAQRLKALNYDASVEPGMAEGSLYYRVRLGRFSSFDQAKDLASGFGQAGYPCIVTAL